MLVPLSLLKMGFITGKQALMMPIKASRHVRRAINEYCFWVLYELMFVVI